MWLDETKLFNVILKSLTSDAIFQDIKKDINVVIFLVEDLSYAQEMSITSIWRQNKLGWLFLKL